MNELRRHKKSDKIKWIITAVCFVLLFAFMAGLCVQLFPKNEKYKPSQWVKKPDTEQTQPDEANKAETAINEKVARSKYVAPSEVMPYGATVTDDDVSALGGETPAYDAEWKAVLTVKNNINSVTANSSAKIFHAVMKIGRASCRERV